MLFKSLAVATGLLALTFTAASSDGLPLHSSAFTPASVSTLTVSKAITPRVALPAMAPASGIVAQAAMKAPHGRAEG